MEPIEVSPNLTCNMISVEPLPRIMDTNIVYIGEDTFNSNTTKKDDTPKKQTWNNCNACWKGGRAKALIVKSFAYFRRRKPLYD